MAAVTRAGIPSESAMLTARELGWSDAVNGRERAAEHESYLGKSETERCLTRSYNAGYIAGTQRALQDRFGDLP